MKYNTENIFSMEYNIPIAHLVHKLKKAHPEIFKLIITFEPINNLLILSVIQLKIGYTNNGIGTKVMKKIVKFADDNRVNMALTTVPLEANSKYSSGTLINFYSKFGFIIHDSKNIAYNMYRKHLE